MFIPHPGRLLGGRVVVPVFERVMIGSRVEGNVWWTDSLATGTTLRCSLLCLTWPVSVSTM